MATTIAPDTSKIQGYLKDIQLSYEEAVRTCNEKNALLAAAQNDFNRTNNYYLKIKGCWESLQTTNSLSVESCGNVNGLYEIANDVKEKLCLNLYITQLLTVEVKGITHKIELYKSCIEKLNSCIKSLIKQDSRLDDKNSLIKALVALEAAWQEALAVAVKILCGLLDALECVYILKCRIAESGLPAPSCPPLSDENGNGGNGTTYGCEYPDLSSPVRDCRLDKNKNPIQLQDQDLCQVVEVAKKLFADEANNGANGFPLYTLKDDGTYEFNCSYVQQTKTKFDTASSTKDNALNLLSEAKKYADLAKSKKASITKSLAAAKAAHKC